MPFVILGHVRWDLSGIAFAAEGLPFLCSVDDVVLAVGGLLRRGGDVGHVAARVGFRDGNARAFSAGEKIGEEPLLELFAAPFDNGRDSKGEAGCQRGSWAG